MLAHIRAVDKNMGMDIDEPGDHQPILGADRLPRIRLAQRWGDFDDLAAGNRDIHVAAQPAARVNHIPATDQQVVSHPPFLRLLLAVMPGLPARISWVKENSALFGQEDLGMARPRRGSEKRLITRIRLQSRHMSACAALAAGKC